MDMEADDAVSITHHTVVINGERVTYTATTGTWVMHEEREKVGASEGLRAVARVFFVAYTRTNLTDGAPSSHPITFSFNGGPGSSSVWMHLGLLGPRRVVMGDAAALTPPPWGLTDNEHSLLADSDLVFIDPTGTGFSRVTDGELRDAFHSYQRDIEQVGDFIRLYCTRARRWPSPKFVIGESYGTTRAGGLAAYLQKRHGLALNGIMLVSNVLNFQTLRFAPGNDLPYILYLPSYAASAWYHNKLDPRRQQSLNRVIEEARVYANDGYAAALAKGDAMTPAEEAAVARKLSQLTGIAAAVVLRCNLRMNVTQFSKALLRAEQRWIGRLDARFSTFDPGVEHMINFEPSSNAFNGPFSAAINGYVREELQHVSDLPYEIMNMRINLGWNWSDFAGRYVDSTEALRGAMCANPHLRVLVCNGYFDLATPFHASEYSINHLQLPRALRGNVRHTYYESGHLMYVHAASRVQQCADLAAFVKTQ